MFIQRWQALEQGHDNVFMSHMYLQIRKLIRERHDLLNMVQQVDGFLYFAYEYLQCMTKMLNKLCIS